TRVMPSYAARIPPDDRWAIVAYIRALQFSQAQPKSSLSAEELQELDKKKLDPAEQAQKDGEAEHEKENAKGGH
ncbi:MAG: cytochrome c, partial [Fimbriimonadaceae bacterium]